MVHCATCPATSSSRERRTELTAGEGGEGGEGGGGTPSSATEGTGIIKTVWKLGLNYVKSTERVIANTNLVMTSFVAESRP